MSWRSIEKKNAADVRAIGDVDVVLAEDAERLHIWSGKPFVWLAVAGGTTFAQRKTKQSAPPEWNEPSFSNWHIADDVAVTVNADAELMKTLEEWSKVLARASVLVVEPPFNARVRHILKLAIVADVRSLVLSLGDVNADDDAERELRSLVASSGGDADNATVIRPERGYDTDDRERLASALAPIMARAAPKSLPTSPLVKTLHFDGPAGIRPEKARLFTGRCVVDAKQVVPQAGSFSNATDVSVPVAQGARITLTQACLPPPKKIVAWIDDANDVVAVRKVRVLP